LIRILLYTQLRYLQKTQCSHTINLINSRLKKESLKFINKLFDCKLIKNIEHHLRFCLKDLNLSSKKSQMNRAMTITLTAPQKKWLKNLHFNRVYENLIILDLMQMA